MDNADANKLKVPQVTETKPPCFTASLYRINIINLVFHERLSFFLSGSQTFSELHFSEDEGNKTPEPTFSAPLDERTGNEGGADYVNLQYDQGELQMGLVEQVSLCQMMFT